MSVWVDAFQAQKQRIDSLLLAKLPSIYNKPESLYQALHYVVLNGGKRIRPLLIYLVGEIFNTPLQQLDNAACAVEFIHAYSLVHDDLPAMDNDDFRRGKPSCHKAFDEATAILVGDALQALAFELLSQPNQSIPPEKNLQMIQVLARAVGGCGMVGGQALDLFAEGKWLTIEEVEWLHRQKTGALLQACVELSMLAAENVDQTAASHLRDYAQCLGLGFQIRDDIRDIALDVASLGKHPGGDIEKQKATYPAMMGLDQARLKLKFLYETAQQSLELFDEKASGLRYLLDDLFL